ncbi:MAG: hypothetical protein Q7K48_01065 [Fusobacterium sp. JB021]|nr:hypothetical protein [Fusobacterium sp. JB021]MDP0505763.1 hypothetical protein [Fusobacterium sp. JB019]
MKIIDKIKEEREKYFGDELPIEKKLYYTTCVLGIVSSFSGFLSSTFGGTLKIGIVVNFLIFLFVTGMCIYGFIIEDSYKGSIYLCLILNFLIFPLMFFFTGGMKSGIVIYFVLGTFLSGILLRGIMRTMISRIVIVWYVVIIKISYDYPILVFNVSDEVKLRFIITSFVMTSLFIYYTTKIFIKSYIKNQRTISELKKNL